MFIVICMFLSYIVNYFQILFGLYMVVNGLIYFVLVVEGTRCIISCLSQHGQRQHRWSLSCVMGGSILWSRSRLLFIYYGLASLKDMCYAEYFVHGKYLSCASATVYLGCEATYADSLLLEYAWLCIS